MPIPSDFSSPERISAKDRSLAHIQRWIIDGTLEPGEKLNDADLASALGVSRTPIREALQLLAGQGLIEMHPGKDTRVVSVDKDDILKLYPTLAVLHALAAERASPWITEQQLAHLQRLNTQFADAVEQGQPFQAMELDEQFHNVIIDAADNPYILSFSNSLQLHIRRFKYVFLKQPFATAHASVQEHEAIIQALVQHDGNTAAVMMKQNLLRPMRELYEMI